MDHINAPEGIIDRMRAGVMTLGKLKKVFYRPLWIIGILLIVGAVYYFEVTPRQLDLEIERIVKTAPSSTMLGDNRILSAVSGTASAAHTGKPNQVAALPTTAPETLVVILIPDNDTAAIRKINNIMHGFGKMQKIKFSKTNREISSSLTVKELAALFNRIEPIAKVSYNQQQFNSFPSTVPVPFVLKLKTAAKPAEDHVPQRAEQTAPVASVPSASSSAEQPKAPAAEVPTSSPADH